MNDVAETLIDTKPGELGWAYRGASREIPRINWKVLPYTPWSDNVTWSKLGVPALLCMSLPDRFFHTQLLTLAELDAETFASSGLVLGMTALVTACADARAGVHIARLVGARGEARLNELALGVQGDPPLPRATGSVLSSRIAYVAERDIASAQSVLRLVEHASDADRAKVEDAVRRVESRLREHAAFLTGELVRDSGEISDRQEFYKRTAVVIPHRTEMIAPHGIPGFSYQQVVELVGVMRADDASVVPETLQLLVDEAWSLSGKGELSIDAITASLGHEFGFQLVSRHILQLMKGMENAGYLELNSSKPSGNPQI